MGRGRIRNLRRKIRARVWSRQGQAGLVAEAVSIILLCFLACGITVAQHRSIWIDCKIGELRNYAENQSDVRAMRLSPDMMKKLYVDYGIIEEDELAEAAALCLAVNDYKEKENIPLTKSEITRMKLKLTDSQAYSMLCAKLKLLFLDMERFPVLCENAVENTVSYSDSWMSERSYGGKRGHEGTDIMADNNLPGYFSIVSVSNGTVENIGWLPQGGYRIGIRSSSGVYYYYAHLHSYAQDMYEGKSVKAGDILGLMGNTGYSEIEGTSGLFDVHLHFGIYLVEGSEEISINPYYLLRILEMRSEG